MAEVLLFHHAQGVTPGVTAFADEIRAAGHMVHVPDLFDGRTFGSIDEGMAFIKVQGFDALRERGVRTADELPAELVYAGFSFGESIAQQLAQTRAGARGALLFYSCIPISGEWAFGTWPEGVPVQIHGADHDPYFVDEGDIDAGVGRSSRRSPTRSCSSTRATSTTSPTAPSPPTTRRPPRCS
jgi:dienelactone hydrolase